MKKSTWAIIILSGVGATIAGYFFFIKKKDDEVAAPIQLGGTKTSPSVPTTSIPKVTTAAYTPFTTQAQGDLFRAWVNKNYPDYAKKNQLDPTGSFNNSYIGAAWNVYGAAYNKSLNPVNSLPAAGANLYSKNVDVVVYSDTNTTKGVRVIRNSPARIGLFVRPSSVNGWWLIRVANSDNSGLEDLYAESKYLTTIAR